MYTAQKHQASETTVGSLLAQAEAILKDGESLRRQGYPVGDMKDLESDLYHLRRHRRRGHKYRTALYTIRVERHIARLEQQQMG